MAGLGGTVDRIQAHGAKGRVNDDDLDKRLARLNARVASRSDETRAELARIRALEMATLCRETFGARLGYLRTDRLEQGQDVESVPYNFDLRGHANAASGYVHGGRAEADVEAQRPADQPYRGRATVGKRRTRKAGKSGARGGEAVAWQHSGRDRAVGPD